MSDSHLGGINCLVEVQPLLCWQGPEIALASWRARPVALVRISILNIWVIPGSVFVLCQTKQ